ncbi:MAG: hypothetical protein LBB21_02070 [Holosporaceae bacterium]|jgi:RNA polymerase sigma-54 factor|nr:hypothetical protein [Holosporaceae bacterium]
MRETANNTLSISTRQTLSQTLQYSLKILAMNNLELQEYISEEFLRNPFLVHQHRYGGSHDFIEQLPSNSNPFDEILRETAFLCFSNLEKEITEMLVRNISENEYLSGDLLKYISTEKGVHYFDLLKIIHRLKKTCFAPMFAFNLQDKLKTFLENENLYNNDYCKLVENISLILSGNWSALQLRCGISKEKLSKMIPILKNAFTSCDFCENICLPKMVDLVIREESFDEFKAVIDDTALVEVGFDLELYTKFIKKSRSESDRSYIKNYASMAKLLVKSVSSRNSTLLKIANEIAYRQSDFFLKKSMYLTPISAQTIACSLLLHKSTINRALSNKFIATPRGIFELKELLPKKIKSQENEVSDQSVKECVKALIANESKNRPLTDCQIANILNDYGINISRRTISKYRDILNISNTAVRTRFYRTVTGT